MNDKEINDILNEDDDFFSSGFMADQVENICGNVNDVKPPAYVFNSLPKLQGSGYPNEFLEMVETVYAYYRMMPAVDYVSTMNELIGLTIKSIPTPTLQSINQELQKVQAVKERISEIMRSIIPMHTIKKRQVEILKESWLRHAVGKSVEQRKADAVFRMFQFESDYMSTDALLKTAMHITKNLDSIQEILSRRITIVGLELKMHDLGRHGLPDYNFGGQSLELESQKLTGDPVLNEDDEDGPLEADELQF